jgi:hypothetical protein
LYEAIRDAWCGSGTASIGTRTKKLKTLFDRARDLLRRFKSYRILPVRREVNKLADQPANRGIDQAIKRFTAG